MLCFKFPCDFTCKPRKVLSSSPGLVSCVGAENSLQISQTASSISDLLSFLVHKSTPPTQTWVCGVVFCLLALTCVVQEHPLDD